MWKCFNVFIELVTLLLLFCVLIFWPWGIWELDSLTRNQTYTPCIGRRSLNYWTAREIPTIGYFESGQENAPPWYFKTSLCIIFLKVLYQDYISEFQNQSKISSFLCMFLESNSCLQVWDLRDSKEYALGEGHSNPLQYSCLENSTDRSLASYSPLCCVG